MVLRFLSRILRRDLGPRDSPPADSPPPISQGGSGNGANVARKTNEVEHMLVNLEREGVKIDGKIASIIVDEVARIKVKAARENMNKLKGDWKTILDSFAFFYLGFMAGVEYKRAILAAVSQNILAAVAEKILFG